MYDLVIIGSGPAGLTAAIYMARARYRVLVVEKENTGGQITITSEVVNYPGILSVSGKELTATMKIQADSFGAEFAKDQITGIQKQEDGTFIVKGTRQEYRTLAVVIATGAHPRRIGFTGEDDFRGRTGSVMSKRHRRCAAVIRIAVNVYAHACRSRNARDDTERNLSVFEHFPLLDVHLEKRLERARVFRRLDVRRVKSATLERIIKADAVFILKPHQIRRCQLAAHSPASECRCPETPRFLTAEQDDFERTIRHEPVFLHTAHDFDRREDTDNAVKIAAARDTVTV